LDKALTEKQLEHLLEFIGYGRLNADIWFLGMEENGGSEHNIGARLKFEQVEDLANAQHLLGITKYHSSEKVIHGLWGCMSEIMLRLEDKKTDDESIRNYQSGFLGRNHGATLLCTLMPIPKLETEEWGYETLLPQFASRQACYEALKADRMSFFRDLVDEYRPKIVIGYGRETWAEYQEIFNQFKFTENNEFLVGWDTDTVVILTDQLDAQELAGKFDEVVAIIRENALSLDLGPHSAVPILSEAELKRQKKEAARQAAVAKRKPSTTHDPADPYCVCAYCLGYEGS